MINMTKLKENILTFGLAFIIGATISYLTAYSELIKANAFSPIDPVSIEDIRVEKKDACVYEGMKKHFEWSKAALGYDELNVIKYDCQKSDQQSIAFKKEIK